MGIEEISGVDPFDGAEGVRISNVLLSMPAHHHNRSLPGAFYLREGGPGCTPAASIPSETTRGAGS
jgi:hypothetical protein